MQTQIHIDVQGKRLDQLQNRTIASMEQKMTKMLEESVKQTTAYAGMDLKFDKALGRLEPLHDRMIALEEYT